MGTVFDCVVGKWKATLGRRIRIAHTKLATLRSRAINRSKPDRLMVLPVLLIVSDPLIDVRQDEFNDEALNISKSFKLDDVLEKKVVGV